jgi:hypothetical protein
MQLAEDARNSEAGGVGVKTNWKVGVKVTKDGSGGESTLQLIESCLGLRCPFEPLIFAKERRHWGGDAGIIMDESTIKIGKAKEDLNIVDGRWGGPFGDCDDTIRLH